MRDKVSSCCQIKWKSSKRDVFYMKKTLEDTWFNYLRLLRCHLSHCSQQQRVSLWKIWRSNDYSNRYFHIQIGMWVLYQDKKKNNPILFKTRHKGFFVDCIQSTSVQRTREHNCRGGWGKMDHTAIVSSLYGTFGTPEKRRRTREKHKMLTFYLQSFFFFVIQKVKM